MRTLDEIMELLREADFGELGFAKNLEMRVNGEWVPCKLGLRSTLEALREGREIRIQPTPDERREY